MFLNERGEIMQQFQRHFALPVACLFRDEHNARRVFQMFAPTICALGFVSRVFFWRTNRSRKVEQTLLCHVDCELAAIHYNPSSAKFFCDRCRRSAASKCV